MTLEAIGSYRVQELLGSGAMGEVYKAVDSKMFDRVVAVKLLNEKFSRNETARGRFTLEIQTAAKLDHPNIVKIYDYGEHEGRPYFVMEYLDGTDLARLMRTDGGRSIERSVEIARQLCEALDFAHRHNVVHRDVKPANVVLVQRGGTEIVKLVDFGIIHVENSNMTRDGTQPGTSAYSSPEQLRNDALDQRSDLFSLGIVLYELFAGVHPFEAPSEALITHHILAREPEAPRKKNQAIPAALDALILKLLEKDPSARPQSAGEVAEALRQQLRKLQSRWASTDPAEYENLDEITRDAVDKLVQWARQKEADGSLQEALGAYEKALKLAPEADRIQRRIPKLRHRIESERMLADLLDKAEKALVAGRPEDAREHWKSAWILAPENEDVASLELRIKAAEEATPDDRERQQYVEDLLARAENDLDEGRLDEARVHIVGILQRYPEDPLANFMLDRILVILRSGADYRAYRAAIREAKDAVDDGRYPAARRSIAVAMALWPGDEEAVTVDRDIAKRVKTELDAVAGRVEHKLLRADDPEQDERKALELVADARREAGRVLDLGGDEAQAAALAQEVDRVESSVRGRIARLEEMRREQEEETRRKIDDLLARGRASFEEASGTARAVAPDAAAVVAAFERARVPFERVLQEDASHAEAREFLQRIETGLRELAERVERRQRAEADAAEMLGTARAALERAEAVDPAASLAPLDEAEAALARVERLVPGHPEAAALRSRAASLRETAARAAEQRAAEQATRRAEAEAAVEEGEAALARARGLLGSGLDGLSRAQEACAAADAAFRRAITADPGNERAATGGTHVADLTVLLEDEIERVREESRKTDEEAWRREEAERQRAVEERLRAEEDRRRAAEAARVEAERERHRREEEARAKAEADKARAEGDRRRLEDAGARRAAEEAKRAEARLLEDERRKREAEEARRRKAEERAASETSEAALAVEPPDSRKIAEFESGLKKYRRLVEQGKRGEASDILKRLRAEAASQPALGEMLEKVAPAQAPGGGRKGLVIGGIAALVVVAVSAGVWMAMRGGGEPAPKPAPPPAPAVQVQPDPFDKVQDRGEIPPPAPAPAPAPAPTTSTPSRPAPAVSTPPAPPKPIPAEPKPAPVRPKPAAPKPAEPLPASPPAAAARAGFRGTIVAAEGQPVGRGFVAVFRRTHEGATATVEAPTRPDGSYEVPADPTDRVELVGIRGPDGKELRFQSGPSRRAQAGVGQWDIRLTE